MAIIKNRSIYSISVVGVVGDKSYRHMVDPGKDLEIPDDQARDWAKRSDRFIKSGAVMVKFAASRSVSKPSEVPTEKAAVSSFGDLHWRKAVTIAEELEELDELAELHEAEERPRVREALEGRMAELNEMRLDGDRGG